MDIKENTNNKENKQNKLNKENKEDKEDNLKNLTKKQLHQKYMLSIDKEYKINEELEEIKYDVCSYCNIDMLLNTNTGYLICSWIVVFKNLLY